MKSRNKQDCDLSFECVYSIARLISEEEIFIGLRYDKYIEFFEKQIKQLRQSNKGNFNLSSIMKFYNSFVEKHESRKKHWDDMKNE